MVAREDLPDVVENALQLWGDPNVQLVLEITERSLVTDPARSFHVLSRIRELGARISIDDFGTGYSCLAYFKDIPADELKIDRSEEHTSELQSLMRISYAVFCLKKKTKRETTSLNPNPR